MDFESKTDEVTENDIRTEPQAAVPEVETTAVNERSVSAKDKSNKREKRYVGRYERVKKPMSREEARKRMDEMDLEKGDVPAMILAAFITFGPILLALIGILLLASWFLTRAG